MNNGENKKGEAKKKKISFAVLYVGSALAFLVILLIGFSLLLTIYLPDKEKGEAPRQYGKATELQKVASKEKSPVMPALATEFAAEGDWAEQSSHWRV
ncbi:MAG TPA: hypothetical protein QF509_08855 [Rhodospirillales bacterium]|nr:hypothetical protein [Rhodospirillales bacterium]